MNSTSNVDPRYKRVLTLKDLILLGLSMTIGSGIFVLIDDVAKYSKNLMWFSMLISGFMSLLTALGYGELASIFKNNTGEYDYIKSITNDKTANGMGFCILVSDIFILSTIALGLGNYVSKITGENHVILIAIMAIIILNILNYCGIRTAANVSNYALYVKLTVILLVIIVSFMTHSPAENLTNFTNADSYGLCMASIIGLFAYLGFNNMTNFTEETINPGITIGKSITYTVIIVTIIYTLISIASLYAMSSSEISQSTTPLALITGKLFGPCGFIFFIVLAIISFIDTILVTCVSESRYIHAFLSSIFPQYGKYDMDEKHKTPFLSIILLTIMSSLIIYLFKNIGTTAIYGDLLILTIFVVVNFIVIILRYKKPDEPRQFKVPWNIGKIPVPTVIAIITGLYAIYQYVHHILT